MFFRSCILFFIKISCWNLFFWYKVNDEAYFSLFPIKKTETWNLVSGIQNQKLKNQYGKVQNLDHYHNFVNGLMITYDINCQMPPDCTISNWISFFWGRSPYPHQWEGDQPPSPFQISVYVPEKMHISEILIYCTQQLISDYGWVLKRFRTDSNNFSPDKRNFKDTHLDLKRG